MFLSILHFTKVNELQHYGSFIYPKFHNLVFLCYVQSGTKTCSKLECPQPDCSGKSGRTTVLPGQCCPICVGKGVIS